MAFLTPGLLFLSRRLLSLVFLSVLIVAIRTTLNAYLSISIPLWICVTTTVAGIPLVLTARVMLEELHHRQRAAALGARMVPRVPARMPGSFDLLATLFREAKIGYPGTTHSDMSLVGAMS